MSSAESNRTLSLFRTLLSELSIPLSPPTLSSIPPLLILLVIERITSCKIPLPDSFSLVRPQSQSQSRSGFEFSNDDATSGVSRSSASTKIDDDLALIKILIGYLGDDLLGMDLSVVDPLKVVSGGEREMEVLVMALVVLAKRYGIVVDPSAASASASRTFASGFEGEEGKKNEGDEGGSYLNWSRDRGSMVPRRMGSLVPVDGDNKSWDPHDLTKAEAQTTAGSRLPSASRPAARRSWQDESLGDPKEHFEGDASGGAIFIQRGHGPGYQDKDEDEDEDEEQALVLPEPIKPDVTFSSPPLSCPTRLSRNTRPISSLSTSNQLLMDRFDMDMDIDMDVFTNTYTYGYDCTGERGQKGTAAPKGGREKTPEKSAGGIAFASAHQDFDTGTEYDRSMSSELGGAHSPIETTPHIPILTSSSSGSSSYFDDGHQSKTSAKTVLQCMLDEFGLDLQQTG
ncbi:hypothetical protein I316_00613 [Kwoniella heveanensis BCC8398]|uniref:DUF5745 domain-containing protein n=1 Tax=Kwoniella heveanensis BCC8398 TaxID=1296120 RepID=A0A1B9H2K2_9TREE|nr:hypothetical protein I316_00613 [Kwoniella heveanensis BCC8398]